MSLVGTGLLLNFITKAVKFTLHIVFFFCFVQNESSNIKVFLRFGNNIFYLLAKYF